MIRIFSFPSKYNDPQAVMELAETVYEQTHAQCFFCREDFEHKDLERIEFEDRNVEACADCLDQPHEEYPEDDRDDLRDR